MRTILLLTLLFLWSCDNTASNNDPIEDVKPDPISSVDTIKEVSPPALKVQEKRMIDSTIPDDDIFQYTVDWCIALDELYPISELLGVLQQGNYKVIFRTNSYGVKDTTKVPALFKTIKKRLSSCLAFSENYPENIIHEWYEDSTTTEQVSYLWFEADIEEAMIEIEENASN